MPLILPCIRPHPCCRANIPTVTIIQAVLAKGHIVIIKCMTNLQRIERECLEGAGALRVFDLGGGERWKAELSRRAGRNGSARDFLFKGMSSVLSGIGLVPSHGFIVQWQAGSEPARTVHRLEGAHEFAIVHQHQRCLVGPGKSRI